jgi:hypothetical protein
MGVPEAIGVTGNRLGSAEAVEEGIVESVDEGEAEALALVFSASTVDGSSSADGAPKAAWDMSESETMDSELTVGLAGEKIKVTLEGEPAEGVEVGAAAELDPEAEALEVTAAAPTDGVEEAVMVGRLGMEEEELDMLVVAGMEAEVEVTRAEAEVEDAVEEIGVMVKEEVMLEAEAEVEAEAEDMDEDEEAISSIFIMGSDSSTESDIDCKSSCEAAAGFQSG